MSVALARAVLSAVTTSIKMCRSFREMPAMVLALAIGVGLTVTCYSLVRAVLLTPLPYGAAEGLVQIWDASLEQTAGMRTLLASEQARMVSARLFAGIANFGNTSERELTRGPGLPPVAVAGTSVSANLFDLLDVHAATGRTLQPRDDQLTERPPIVVSERLVRAGLVSGTVGEAVTLDGVSYRLVGTMPASFWFPDREALYWTPILYVPPAMLGGGAVSTTSPALARLASGTSLEAAEAQATALAGVAGDAPGARRVRLASYQTLLTDPVRPTLVVLQGASGLVLLLVCLNVGWLFTARARRLRPAFATMRALGATPGHVLGTHLVSAVGVSIIAVPFAVFLAWLLLRIGLSMETGVFSHAAEPAITRGVVGVTLFVAALASAGSAVPGAWASAHWHGTLVDSMRAASRGRLFQRWTMVMQVGLVFAIAAQGILIASVLHGLARTNVGLAKTDFLVASIGPRHDGAIEADAQAARYRRLVAHLAQRGVHAAVSNLFPLKPRLFLSTFEPRYSRDQQRAMVRIHIVTPSYFEVTGTTPTQGRLLTAADAGAFRLVVTDAFVADVLRRQDPIGARTGPAREWTVVGTVPAMRQKSIDEVVQPEAYMLYEDYIASRRGSTSGVRDAYVLAEMPRGAAATTGLLRTAMAEDMPDMELREAAPADDLIAIALGANRLVAAGSAVFAFVALTLAAFGLGAMVGHGLAMRRREIGIRMALGATGLRIGIESVRPIALVYGAGLVVGLSILFMARSAIESAMVPPPGGAYPPIGAVGGVAAVVLAVVVAAACYVPIRTASGTNPAECLRAE